MESQLRFACEEKVMEKTYMYKIEVKDSKSVSQSKSRFQIWKKGKLGMKTKEETMMLLGICILNIVLK